MSADPPSAQWIFSDHPQLHWWGNLLIFLPIPLALFGELALLLGPSGLAYALALSPPRGDFDYTLIAWTMGIVLPVLGLLLTANQFSWKIAAEDSRIEVATLLGKSRVGWDEIRWVSPIVHDEVSVSYFPSGGLFHGTFHATRSQARALVANSRWPKEFARPELLAWAAGTVR